MTEPIKRVPVRDNMLETVFQSADGWYGAQAESEAEKKEARERQADIAQAYSKIEKQNKVESLGIWQAARTPNNFNINAQQALDPFMNLNKGQHVTFFDIEAGGTPSHLRGKDGLDMFFMTELSFGGTQFDGKNFSKDKSAIMSLAVAPSQNDYERLKAQIKRLKKNPMANVGDDMHRTLLDLAKYADVKNFKSGHQGGIPYASLKGHARVPAAKEAFTRNTIKEVERGLNNLFFKGTKREDALTMMKKYVQDNKSTLAGFNIDHYDMPAILGSTTNQNTRNFFQNASKKALDFYHAYAAVEKDPYSTTGASTRQEHIHQYLMKKAKNPIETFKDKYLYHLAADDIQANIEIAGFIRNRVNKYVDKVMNKSSFALNPAQINQNPMVGDMLKGNLKEEVGLGTELFAYQSGGFDPQKHKYSMVGRIGKDGKIAPRWDELNTSLPANESFFVREFFKDVELPGQNGKKGFGVRLDGKDYKDKSLLLFSETEEGLAQQLHGSFMPIDSKAAAEFRDLKVMHDAPFREYEKMFEYGGFKRMKENYSLLEQSKANPGTSIYDIALKNGKSEEYARKMPHMVERLEAEGEVWKKALKEIGTSTLSDDQKDFALQTIKKKMDQLGHNKTEVNNKGIHGKFFEFEFGKDDRAVFNAKNSDAIKGAFRSHITGRRSGERVGNAEKSYKKAKIKELEKLVISNFELKGSEAKKVSAIAKGMVSEVHSANKIETALTSLANFVRDRVENKGDSTFTREVTNEVTSQRRQAISAMTAQLPDVLQHSIDIAQTRVKADDIYKNNSKLKTFVEQQDEYIKKLFMHNFGGQGRGDRKAIKEAGEQAAKYKSYVKDIVKNYSYDFHTEIKFTEDGKALLVLADKESGKALVGSKKTYKDILTDARIATVELPRFNDGLKVQHGANQKVARMRSGLNDKGQYHSTSVTDALKMIAHYSEKAKHKKTVAKVTGKKNHMVEISKGLSYRVSRQVDPAATDPNAKYEAKEEFEVRNRVGSEVRNSKWDITGYAEKWYENNYIRLGLEAPSRVKERSEKSYKSFYEEMSGKAKNLANSGSLLNFANSESGLNGTVFGNNKLAGSKGVVSTDSSDPRNFMALGHYNADSVENPHKTANYRKVETAYAERALKKAGKNQDFRLNNSFITKSAYAKSQEKGVFEARGLQMQSAYVEDNEIALKLRDAATVQRFKGYVDEAVKKGAMSPKEGRNMKSALDMGMLSTSEGLGMIDADLIKAFDGLDEIRVNVNADKIMFDNVIENAIEAAAVDQGLDGFKWKETGITLNKPLEINLDHLMDEKDKLTIGKYWNNEIKNDLVQENRFRKGDTISILGFDASGVKSKSLVLGRERRTGHGFKGSTEGGIRGTYLPTPGQIMDELSGVSGTEVITQGLEAKKGASELPALIRGYDTQIRQQFAGTAVSAKSEVLKKFGSEEEALKAYYADLKTTMGIDTENVNGQYLVADNFGIDGKHQLSYEKRNEFSKRWQGTLGLDREIYGEIMMAHDVWTRQGGKDRGKITPKEIDMMDRSMVRAGITKPGEESHLARFWKDMTYGSLATEENLKNKQVLGEVIRAAGEYNHGWSPKAGDVVIDYTTDGMASLGDTNAQQKNGILHVAKDSFEAIPEKAGDYQTYSMADYNRTIVNSGKMNFQLDRIDKATNEPVKGTIQGHLMKTKGLSYMKLPSFASDEYIPLLDTSSMDVKGPNQKDKEMYLDVLKGHYAKIDRKTNEYNSLFSSNNGDPDVLTADDEAIASSRKILQDEINDEIGALKNTIAASTSSDNMAKVLATRAEMSTQLQFGGVNPALAYKKEDGKWTNNGVAKEGEIFMNEKTVRDLIGDNAENIVKSWDVDTTKIKGSITDYAIANWNEKGVYSTNIRYPSIDVGTTQALQVKISDAVGDGQAVGLRGMAERISADYDGDNLAVFLSHYGIEDDERRSQVLTEIKKLHTVDTSKNELAAKVEMEKIEKDFKTSIAKAKNIDDINSAEVQEISDAFFSGKQMTLGSLHGEEAQLAIQENLKDATNYDHWGTIKTGEFGQGAAELEKSLLALGTAGTIGSVDNTRMRMSAAFTEVARVKYERFNGANGKALYSQDDFIRETSMVDEFLREYSQKAISAKKAEGSKATAGEIVQDLYTMIENVNNPSKIDNFDTVAADLVERGLFSSRSPFLEARNGEIYSPDNANPDYRGSKHDFIKKTLMMLSDTEEVLNEAGFKGYRHSSLMMAAGQGMGIDDYASMIRTGKHLGGGSALGATAEMAAEQGYTAMVNARDRVSDGLERIMQRKNDNVSSRLEESSMVEEIMNQNRKPGSEVLSNEAVPIHRTIRGGMNDSLAELATAAKGAVKGPIGKIAAASGAGFGGLWATTALMKGAPTPEGMEDMAPVPMETLGAPTARITPNQSGEYLNIKVNAKSAQRMNNNDLAAMLNNEIMAMSNVNMRTSVNVNDNSQEIDNKWMQSVVANVMDKGYAYS